MKLCYNYSSEPCIQYDKLGHIYIKVKHLMDAIMCTYGDPSLPHEYSNHMHTMMVHVSRLLPVAPMSCISRATFTIQLLSRWTGLMLRSQVQSSVAYWALVRLFDQYGSFFEYGDSMSCETFFFWSLYVPFVRLSHQFDTIVNSRRYYIALLDRTQRVNDSGLRGLILGLMFDGYLRELTNSASSPPNHASAVTIDLSLPQVYLSEYGLHDWMMDDPRWHGTLQLPTPDHIARCWLAYIKNEPLTASNHSSTGSTTSRITIVSC